MKVWKKYTNYLLSGEWHVHTNYTDGKNTVREYCERAMELGIPLIAFTEHVRRMLDYDFNDFLNDIEKAREEFDLIILSGCEAKVLPNGELDVEDWILREVDYPIFAFHSFPRDLDLYLGSLKKVLRNKYVNTWAHPGVFLRRYGFELGGDDLINIFKLMNKHEVLLEINSRYNVPSKEWIDLAKGYGVGVVHGSDAHSLEAIDKNGNMKSYLSGFSRIS